MRGYFQLRQELLLAPVFDQTTPTPLIFEAVPALRFASAHDVLREYADCLAKASQGELAKAARDSGLTLTEGRDSPLRLAPEHCASYDRLEVRIHKVIRDFGFSFDTSKFDNWDDCIVEPRFWLGLIRSESKVRIEQALRELGRVRKGGGAGCYVSDITLRRYLADRKRSQHNLSLMEAVNDLGESFSLDELVKKGNANPAIQRIELMVRFKGMEDWAEQDNEDWTAISVTITTPSKFHLHSKGKINAKYNGATPSDVRDYLQTGWESTRKRLHEKEIKFFGGRIAEPHHDGCPHWHLLLFVRKQDESTLIEQLRKMAFRDDASEPGAAKHRFAVEKIDPEKGSAVGYVAKYIAKNIDGFGIDLDEESGGEASESAKRVRAWASTWGIRQFQMIGGPEIGTWRELRRLSKADIQKMSAEVREIVDLAHTAADEGNWCDFITAMGGALCQRSERPVRLARLPVMTQDGGREVMVVRGVNLPAIDHFVLTRIREWTIRKKAHILTLCETRIKSGVQFLFGVPVLGGQSPPLDLCK
jgi:hypothetical protein